jgi:hypothetical protein
MKNNSSYPTLAFLVLVFISLLFFGNFQYAKLQPGGTDFLYRWLPTRLVLLKNYQNPYSPEVEYQVELIHHGHAHQEDETPGIFAYPYYTMAVFSPFALISDFTVARAAWMTISEIAYIVIIFLTLKMTGFRPSHILITALILFAFLNADFAQGLIDGNPAGLAAMFAFLSLYFLSQKSDRLAGMFLAFSTIKPQLIILFFALVCIWALFQRRWAVIYSFAATMIILLGLSFLLQPSWFLEFLKDVTTYTDVARPSTPRAIFSYWMPIPYASYIALATNILFFLVLFLAWRKCFGRDFNDLLWAACITFTIMPFTGITSAKSNYIAMLPGVILLIQYGYDKIWKSELLPAAILLIWVVLSWLFFHAGRNWVVEGRLIYFVDFFPMPLVLIALFLLVYFSKKTTSQMASI